MADVDYIKVLTVKEYGYAFDVFWNLVPLLFLKQKSKPTLCILSNHLQVTTTTTKLFFLFLSQLDRCRSERPRIGDTEEQIIITYQSCFMKKKKTQKNETIKKSGM